MNKVRTEFYVQELSKNKKPPEIKKEKWQRNKNQREFIKFEDQYLESAAAAAAAKSCQSCLTPCDPIDSSPPGFSIPGILQARTLEWAAISFSHAWKWKVKVKLLSRVWLFTNTMDCSLPGSSVHGILQARVLEWGAIAFSDLESNICIIGVVEREQEKKKTSPKF